MQSLSIETATPDSAEGLFGALVRFSPRWSTGEDGRHVVSVKLRSETQVLAVLDAIRAHCNEGAEREDEPGVPATPPPGFAASHRR